MHFRPLVPLLCCTLASLSTPGFAQSAVTWLPPAYTSKLQATAQAASPAVQHAILDALYARHILSKQNNLYRAVKIKLMNQGTSAAPYALVYLYSNALFNFTVVRVNLTADHKVLDVQENYTLKSNDFVARHALPNVCPPSALQAKALLFLPDYQAVSDGEGPCSDAAKAVSYLNQQTCTIFSAIKNYYSNPNNPTQPDQIVALFGKDATRDNFGAYASCPNLQFLMQMGSEYAPAYGDPANRGGTAFWSVDPSDPVTSTDVQSRVHNLKNLRTIVFTGGHLFSNNTPDGICPVLGYNKTLHTYLSTTTSIDVPGAAATYACMIKGYVATGKVDKKTVADCGSQYEPYKKDTQSTLVYITNTDSYNLTLSTQPNPLKINGFQTVAWDSTGNTSKHPLLGPSGIPCKDLDKGTADSIETATHGTFIVTKTSESGGTCIVSNAIHNLPLSEKPSSEGSGVIVGLWYSSAPPLPFCTPIKTAFSYAINDQSQGQCDLSNISFSLTGNFEGVGINQPYKPVQHAAATAGTQPDSVTFDNIIAGQPPTHSIGYYYTGEWTFNIDPDSVHGLLPQCKLTVDATNSYFDNDLTAKPTTVPVIVSFSGQ